MDAAGRRGSGGEGREEEDEQCQVYASNDSVTRPLRKRVGKFESNLQSKHTLRPRVQFYNNLLPEDSCLPNLSKVCEVYGRHA